MKTWVRWSDHEIDILRAYYGKIRKKELLKLLPARTLQGVSWQAVKYNLVSDRHVTNKRTLVNDDFFNDINPLTCYYAGLVAADGCIIKDGRSFTLHQKDISVLERFVKEIGYTGSINKRQISNKIDNYCHSVNITSKKIVQDLELNFNIIPQKSLILKPPDKLNYFHSLCFIVGYLDGDGYISFLKYKNKKPYLVIGILGTQEMCLWIKEVLGIGRIEIRKDCKNPIYRYTCSHNIAIEVIGKLWNIQELKNVRMERKWSKYEEYFNGC